MMRTLLVRGMLAGLAAGVLATVFAYVVGERAVNAAIDLEHTGHGGEEPLVSRAVQSTVGLFTGVGAYGIAIGGLFAIVFALGYGRLGTLRPLAGAAWLAAGAFVVVVVVPFLKYPANPPAVGSAASIGDRTALYFGFLALSLVAGIVAVAVGRRLAGRLGAWRGGLIGAATYVVLATVAAALLPVVDEVPAGFPGSTLWSFRIAALGTQLVLWTTLGLVFGALAERVLRPVPAIVAAGQR
ncbi:CbtA family protein [Saccharomonospora sp. NPDC046836]|uniref:CbtA family protein n=1 Tax=Saccharomonospora sp. NPDC046836 TaxID=3156921 RepID=UPI0034016EF6